MFKNIFLIFMFLIISFILIIAKDHSRNVSQYLIIINLIIAKDHSRNVSFFITKDFLKMNLIRTHFMIF
jgi:hypothetical protein